MKFKILVLMMLILPMTFSYAQEKKILESKEDIFEEMDHQNLTLRFFNAINGNEISGASVDIDKIGAFRTDQKGKVRFPIPSDGIYKVSFRKKGYVDSDFEIKIMVGTIFFNRFSVSPALDIRYLRVVLDWDKWPFDLDSHLVKKGGYHISYRDMHTVSDGSANLDRDDTDSYGPETITVKKVDSRSHYNFFVHDYTNRSQTFSSALSRSKACIKVYGEGRLLHIFRVPQDVTGTTWEVFRIEHGRIMEVNKVTERAM
jgi:hypothetical protein